MKLYRGDHYENSTEPGRYRMDGIRSKSFGKGSPRHIKTDELRDTIINHINPISKADFLIYNSTEYLSFSTSESRARYWLSKKGREKISVCTDEYSETHYLFCIEIDEKQLLPIAKNGTIYRYNFCCNTKLNSANSNSILERAIFSLYDENYPIYFCQRCANGALGHSILLIDTVNYLKAYPGSAKSHDALMLALEDREWLILPTDLKERSITTIPRADFWTVQHFVSEDGGREKDFHMIQGH